MIDRRNLRNLGAVIEAPDAAEWLIVAPRSAEPAARLLLAKSMLSGLAAALVLTETGDTIAIYRLSALPKA